MNAHDATVAYLVQKHGLMHDTRQPPVLVYGKRYPYMTDMFKDLNFKIGVEIGVRGAPFSQQMGRSMPGLQWWAIDPYESYGQYASNGKSRETQESMDRFYEEAKAALAPYDCIVLREYSHVAVERFEDESIDFIHIDGNHEFEYVWNDIQLWTPKIRSGGIISCHDYLDLWSTRSRVKSAVDKWTADNSISPWYVIVGSSTPTAYWVK